MGFIARILVFHGTLRISSFFSSLLTTAAKTCSKVPLTKPVKKQTVEHCNLDCGKVVIFDLSDMYMS